MFPIDLLKKLIEVLLSEVFKDEYSRSRHPKRRFARELLAVYEDVKVYSGCCRQFLEMLERERELVPSGRVTPGTARELRTLTRAMAEIIRSIIDRFGDDVHRTFIDPESAKARRRRIYPHGRGERDRTVLEIMYPELASILDRATESDTMFVMGLDVLTCELVDQQRVRVPREIVEDIQQLQRSHDSRYMGSTRADRGDVVGLVSDLDDLMLLSDTFDLRDEAQFQSLRRILTSSIGDADQLVQAIGSHLRTRSTVDDLL